ncbi:MAG: SRPBCC domain-containing protein [Pseudomonadota bacterium]
MTDPIIKELTVPLTPERAFRLFTEEMSDWWPLDTHSLSASDGDVARAVKVPDHVGAQVEETKPDGSRVPWGRVTEYDPGAAFGMSWHVGQAEDMASHVRVTFTEAPNGTQVRLIHDVWETMGPQAKETRAGYDTGWDFVLRDRFGAAVKRLKVIA